MPQPCVFLVSDDHEKSKQAKTYLESIGFQCDTYTFSQWKEGLSKSEFILKLNMGTPTLVSSFSIDGKPTNIIQFPQGSPGSTAGAVAGSAFGTSSKVATIEEMESKAIEGAIQQFRGNLTEAAKALGIGRATLYRKVKQYQIDPSSARRRRAA